MSTLSNVNRINAIQVSTTPITFSKQKDESALICQALPNEIFLEIFGYLSANDLVALPAVCKKFYQLSSPKSETGKRLWEAIDLRKLFPKLCLIDEKTLANHVNLAKYELDLTDYSPPPKHILRAKLAKLFESLKVKDDAGITLVTMPKGLKLHAILDIASKSNISYSISDQITTALKNTKVQATYLVAITNSVLQDSLNTRLASQESLAEQHNGEIPDLLTILTLAVLTEKISKKRLYNMVFTRCANPFNLNNGRCLGIGSDGNCLLSVLYDYYDPNNNGLGFALQKKLS
jgi:hypothetical protein